MADPKDSDFITRSRQIANRVLSAIGELDALRVEWDSLFNTTVTEEDFDGTNSDITLADVTNLMTTQGAIDTLMDAGNRTNLLKVK